LYSLFIKGEKLNIQFPLFLNKQEKCMIKQQHFYAYDIKI